MTMLGASAPLIALAHDATSGIEQATTFPTRIIPRRNGTEQRLGLSHRATETLTYRIHPRDRNALVRDSALVKVLAQQATDRIVRMPRWEDDTALTAPALAGDVVISCDTSDRPGFVDGVQVLLWRDASTLEVREIAVGGVAPDAITLVDPLESDWRQDTVVVPVHAGRVILPTTLTHWRSRSAALSLAIEFSLRDIAGVGPGGTAVAGVPDSLGVTGQLTLNRGGRGTVEAFVYDAAGNRLPGTGIVWTTDDGVNAPIYALLDPGVAMITNGKVGAGSISRTYTATLGSLSASGSVTLNA